MKTKTFYSVFVLFLLVIFSTGCNKSNDNNDENTMKDLVVPDGFTFETTKNVKIKISMPQTVNFSDTYRSRFNIYTANPNEGGKLILSGGFDDNGEFSGEIKVPSAQEKIYVKTIAGDMELDITGVGFKDDGVIIDFGEDYGFNPPDTTEPGEKSSQISDNLKYTNTLYDSKANIISNGNFETNDFGTIYQWYYNVPYDGRWYITQDPGSMEWYNDNGNHVFRTPWKEPGNYYYGGVVQMIDVGPGDVVTFSADIKSVGNNNRLYSMLYLIPVRANGSAIAYYSLRYYHPSSQWTTKTVTATMPNGTAGCKVLVWANDYTANAAVYCDNVVVIGPTQDADNDGVDDDVDDFPNDPSRAFKVLYPNETDWGTLAFEDLWPGEGDYDFNDLVLDYHFQSNLSSTNKLVDFYLDYSTRAVGASLINGFGLMLGGAPENVESVTGSKFTENYLDINSNGTEKNQNNTVIFLFDNAFNTIGSSGSQFINTKTDVPYVKPDTNQIYVLYKTPALTTTTGTAPYNPFIVVDKTRGKEVHLAGEKPTDLVDNSLFGTWADDSDPASGKYYQTANNLPWALDLPVSFDYPVEQVEIINAYNHFVEWAESAGNSYPDWYEDNSGYRNSENIYSPPEDK